MTKLFQQVPAQVPFPGPTCSIAFVAEAPSDYERLYGFPLVGPSGRTFDQMLRVAGLAQPRSDFVVPPHARRVASVLGARSAFLVTNVFDAQLPGNDVKAWCSPPQVRKDWGEDYKLPRLAEGFLRPEFGGHLDRLRAELEAARPNIIVPLGATALWALTGLTDIMLARGTVLPARFLVPGTKVLATYHPEHIQHDWRLFHVAVADLTRAAYEAQFLEIRSLVREIHIRPNRGDLVLWTKQLTQASRLSVDIETAKQQITCIGFAPSATEAFVIPFVDYEQSSRSYWPSVEDEVAAWQAVREICESNIPKTLQNGTYDYYYLVRQAGIWLNGYDRDTRLQHHALYPELPKSLAFMGATYESPPGPWKTLRERAQQKRDD